MRAQSLAKFFASSIVFLPGFRTISAASVFSKEERTDGSSSSDGRGEATKETLFFFAASFSLSAKEALSPADIDETKTRFFPNNLLMIYSNSFPDTLFPL